MNNSWSSFLRFTQSYFFALLGNYEREGSDEHRAIKQAIKEFLKNGDSNGLYLSKPPKLRELVKRWLFARRISAVLSELRSAYERWID